MQTICKCTQNAKTNNLQFEQIKIKTTKCRRRLLCYTFLEHTLSHTIEDSVTLLPFLFFTYLLMELLEHTTGGKVQNKIRNAGKVDRFVGRTSWNYATVRVFCRSVSLYAGRVITVGTRLPYFLSTSDEIFADFHFRVSRTGNDY